MKKILKFRFTEEQAKQLIKQQSLVNNMMSTEWLQSTNDNIAYYRAAYVEAVEVLSVVGFKWWKKEEIDTNKVFFELIDILHFVISDHIRYFGKKYREEERREAFLLNSFTNIYSPKVERIGRLVGSTANFEIDQLSFRDICDQSVYHFINQGMASIDWLAVMFERLSISNDKAAYYYLAKNTLNRFRDDNGQKEGIYVRTWIDRDDNDILYEYIEQSLMEGREVSVDDIYNYLQTEYNKAIKNV